MNIQRLLSTADTRRPRTGVTLLEVMISMVLVSTILLVTLIAAANLQRNHNTRRQTNDGYQLAHQFLDEVTSMAYQDSSGSVFGLEPDEDIADRTTFDDVDDYHGFLSSPPTYRNGTAIRGYEGWSISITVTPADADATGIRTTESETETLLRWVAVSCTSDDGTRIDSHALVSGVPGDHDETASYEQWRRIQLMFPDREINVAAPLRNQPDSLDPTP